MDPSVLDYVYRGPADPLIDIYASLTVLQSPTLAVAAAIAVALVVMVAAWRERRQMQPWALHWPLLWATVMLLATYTLTSGNVDEVAINLEHPFNLYHFGRFSFSPARMVDGTVEYAYYLLLMPFGGSASTLVIANFGLGLLIAWLHLLLLARLLDGHKTSTRLGLLALFAVNYPIISLMASGFGGGLVSLGLLVSLVLHFSGRTSGAAMVASALPLLRPDAVLYSYAVMLATMERPGVNRQTLIRWAGPLVAAGVYLVGIRMAYGHWIPTPISFKSVYPTMLEVTGLSDLVVIVMDELSKPPQLLALLAVVASFWWPSDARLSVVRRLLVPTSAIFVFYALTRTVFGDYSGDVYARYWIGFELALFVGLLLVLARVATALDSNDRAAAHFLVFGRLVPIAIVLLASNAVLWAWARQPLRNRSFLGVAGQIVDRAVPPDFVLATSELNAFGLVIPNREVIDLWGYTNPSIAHARVLNGARIRNNPDLFLSIKPDVYFAHRSLPNQADTENYLASFEHFTKTLNLLGDMNLVLDEYDIMLLRHPEHSVFLLVRRTSVAALRESLGRRGYELAGERALDRPAFDRQYAGQQFAPFSF